MVHNLLNWDLQVVFLMKSFTLLYCENTVVHIFITLKVKISISNSSKSIRMLWHAGQFRPCCSYTQSQPHNTNVCFALASSPVTISRGRSHHGHTQSGWWDLHLDWCFNNHQSCTKKQNEKQKTVTAAPPWTSLAKAHNIPGLTSEAGK